MTGPIYLRGWYIPADDQPEDDVPAWNPYWTDGKGNWIEAQSSGHTSVDFPDGIMWPLYALVPEPGTIHAPERSDADT